MLLNFPRLLALKGQLNHQRKIDHDYIQKACEQEKYKDLQEFLEVPLVQLGQFICEYGGIIGQKSSYECQIHGVEHVNILLHTAIVKILGGIG